MTTALPAEVGVFRASLLAWYDEHRRTLPWRKDRDPYRVWVSEIMLQQTRVAAVLEHYRRFMERFPDVNALASAREQSVLAMWSGLGYYHRARRMHKAAKVIARERQGSFPRTAKEWMELPGIGRYTASAITSIVFGEPVAVVDGNVERVLTRLTGQELAPQIVWQAAEALLDRGRPGDFNQAMMELGATICTPRAPQCLVCPVLSCCQTRGSGAKGRRATRHRKDLSYALVRRKGRVFLVQRPADAELMAGMWELPGYGSGSKGETPLARFRHAITSTDYAVSVYEKDPGQLRQQTGRWCTRQQWEAMALTGLARKILRKLRDES